ncbi:DNA-directed DNA polymerase alpha subunit pol12 [Tulasnella sp. 419]|nr:DNA-directed DNA polymerase alpha subunit pol12 [Tulasnella sp. 419]
MDIDEDKPENLESGLRNYFAGAVDTPEVMSACVSLCKAYNLEPQDLYFRWEAFSYTTNQAKSISRLTPERIQPLREHLQREFKANVAIATPRRPPPTASAKITASKSAYASRIMGQSTPVATRIADGATGSPAPSSRLAQSTVPLNSVASKNRIVPPKILADYSYRYMYEKIHERSNALDNRINEMAEIVKDYYSVEDDFADPNADTEEDVIVIGRICDSSADGKLTEGSIVLEPSKWMGSGRRIPIQFSSTFRMYRDTPPAGGERAGMGFFPGAIAAFKGNKAHSQEGGFFMVKELLPVRVLINKLCS